MLQTINATADAIIFELTKAHGNLALCAERLKISQDTLISILASDPVASRALYDQARLTAVIHVLDLLNVVKIALVAAIPDMQPYEISKTFAALLQTLNATINQTQSTSVGASIADPTEHMMKLLPPHVKRALMAVISPETDDRAAEL